MEPTRHWCLPARGSFGALARSLEMTVEEAVSAAESILPGHAASDGEVDARWQAIIAVSEFIQTEPEVVWSFARKWGAHPDKDLRMAISTCVLEHLLECHFDAFISRVEEAAKADQLFAKTVSNCWKIGQSDEATRAARLDRLKASIRGQTG
jgi:hypothetical protein